MHDRMTDDRLEDARRFLGKSRFDMARALDMKLEAYKRLESGEEDIPGAVRDKVMAMVRAAERERQGI